jgi:hypothetical protein
VCVCVCVQYLLVGQFVFLVWGSGAPLRDVCVPLPHCSTPLCQSSHGVYACVYVCVCVCVRRVQVRAEARQAGGGAEARDRGTGGECEQVSE